MHIIATASYLLDELHFDQTHPHNAVDFKDCLHVLFLRLFNQRHVHAICSLVSFFLRHQRECLAKKAINHLFQTLNGFNARFVIANSNSRSSIEKLIEAGQSRQQGGEANEIWAECDNQ